MTFVPDPDFQIEEAIRRWVLEPCDTPEDKRRIEQLRETVIKIAHDHLESGPTFQPRHLDEEDLSDEFLLHLRKEGKWMIYTKTGLKCEYSRWVPAFLNPAQHELWEILSIALHALAVEDAAWRLDALSSEPNNNYAVWTGIPEPDGAHACDLPAFERAARRIPKYTPPAARKWHDDDDVVHKVILPDAAMELTLALLRAADGSLHFYDLFEEFKKHVWVFNDGGDNKDAPYSIHPAAIQRLYPLAHERAGLIWNEILAIHGTNLFCGYFIPKHMDESSVILEKFGEPQRVSERIQDVVRILRQHLDLNMAEALDVDDNAVDASFHGRFVSETMHILREKCGCCRGKTAT